MAIGKKVSDKVKNKLAGKEKGSRDPGPILRYPLNLVEKDNQELIRFRIVDRKTLEDQRSIYLYSPPGLSIADAAGYTQADLGLLGGAIDAGGDVLTGKKDMDGSGITDIVSAAVTGAAGKLGAAGQATMITGGVASNPYTNVQFTGTNLRSFAFSFKMVAESPDESDAIKNIENTFRKFLYPKKLTSSDFLLEYPPLFKIEFMKLQGGDAAPNKFMPFIQYSYLLNMTATFNSATNLFHKSGAPVELDLALTFQESKALKREDLYGAPEEYNTAEYHREFRAPYTIPSSELTGDQ
jgi:hypothetical protein